MLKKIFPYPPEYSSLFKRVLVLPSYFFASIFHELRDLTSFETLETAVTTVSCFGTIYYNILK